MNLPGKTEAGSPKEQIQQAHAVFSSSPYASALIPDRTASALRSSLRELDEVEAEFPGLSSKTNLFAMLTATL